MAKKKRNRMTADEVAAHDRAITNSCAVVRSVIGSYLRHMRFIANLNQEDIGAQGTISRMERGDYNGDASGMQNVLEKLSKLVKNKLLNRRNAKSLAALYAAARYQRTKHQR